MLWSIQTASIRQGNSRTDAFHIRPTTEMQIFEAGLERAPREAGEQIKLSKVYSGPARLPIRAGSGPFKRLLGYRFGHLNDSQPIALSDLLIQNYKGSS